MKKVLLLPFLAVLFAFGCETKPTTPVGSTDSTKKDSALVAVAPVDSAKPKPAAPQDSTTLLALGKEIMRVAAKKDYAKLADYIHPTLGLRFSPYTYVDVENDRVFLPQAFRDQAKKAKEKILWGTYDPMGEPIKSTMDGYFKEFCNDKPYMGPNARWAYNETIGGGTTINNIAEVYPEHPFVEAYWAPEDEEKMPYEWGSVRLVFKQHEAKYYLVGFVHDAWST